VITCGEKGRLYQCKGNGMVRDIFSTNLVSDLYGSMGVGHVRYPTVKSIRSNARLEHLQPQKLSHFM